MRDVSDDREVMGDVHDRDSRLQAQALHLVQDERLGNHVETRCRLIHHEHCWLADEGHRDREALLLAARELVRESTPETPVIGKSDLGQNVADPRWPVAPVAVSPQHFREQHVNPQRRVQRDTRVLRHVGNPRAALCDPLGLAHPEQVLAVNFDATLDDLRPRSRIAQGSQGHGRLTAARLADEPKHLTRPDLEADVGERSRHPTQGLP